MSRIGVWRKTWNTFVESFKRERPTKIFIGEDLLGNKYYETLCKSDSQVRRCYESKQNSVSQNLPLEWESWLRGTRRLPPNDDEMKTNQIRQQICDKTDHNRIVPVIGVKGNNVNVSKRSKEFPKYDDYELQPGTKKST